MLSFVSCLQVQHTKFGSDSEEVPTLITDLLATAISATDYYQPVKKKAPASTYSYYQSTILEPSPTIALLHIHTSMNTRNDQLVDTIIDKLVSVTGVTANEIWNRGQTVLLPLIPKIQALLKSRPEGARPIQSLAKLHRSAITFALHLIQQQGISSSSRGS